MDQCIIDECSFMDVTQVENLDGKLCALLNCYKALHIVFCGDFRQLEPIAGKPLYSTKHTEKSGLTLSIATLSLKDYIASGRILSGA